MKTNSEKIPFIDLAAQQKQIRANIDKRIANVLNHGKYIMGPEVFELESRLCEYLGVKHSVTCSSGTDALLMILMANNIGPGDAVFAPPFTFMATAEVRSFLGATPVFVDVDPNTCNIDPECLEKAIEAVVNRPASTYPVPESEKALKPRCIIPVDLFGSPAEYERINTIADKYNLFVLEDAAQSFGASYKNKKTCTLAHAGATSFFPAKPLGCYGDGGAVFTDDDELAEKLKSIRVHGKGDDKYDNVKIGINGRLDTIQAAILLAKLDIFDQEVENRNRVASLYAERLKDRVSLQSVSKNCTSVWAQYSVCHPDRHKLMKHLNQNNIPTAVYYPKPLHCQTAFSYLGYKPEDFPNALALSESIFSLPMHPYLMEEQIDRICGTLIEGLK